jgi:CheY-like chemotaxis protein
MKVVFLIDDDEDDREIFGEALSALEYNTRYVEAVNGLDALEKLQEPEFSRPDVIFLDLNMPKMDGREFLVAVKQLEDFRNIPVIIYSTSSNTGDIQFSMSHQAADFITKHHSISELIAELERVIRSL